MRTRLGLLLAAAATALCVAAPARAASTTVLIGASFFDPQTVVVQQGDSVTWTNGEGRHTVTADGGAFDSGPLAEGQTFSFQFNQPGTYPYRDRLGGAHGTVVVQAVGNVAPSAAFSASPTSTTAGTAISFDARASRDPDGFIAHFRWDFDGDGTYDVDTGTSATVSRSFPRAGTYRVGLLVEDDRGSSAIAAPVTVTVLPPQRAPDTAPPDLSVLATRPRLLPGQRPRVRLAVGEPATLRVRVLRLRGHGRRPATVATFRRRVRAGDQRLRYRPGRLRPARYRVTIVAADRAGNRSPAVTTDFVVRKPPKKQGDRQRAGD